MCVFFIKKRNKKEKYFINNKRCLKIIYDSSVNSSERKRETRRSKSFRAIGVLQLGGAVASGEGSWDLGARNLRALVNCHDVLVLRRPPSFEPVSISIAAGTGCGVLK